jgi:alpha-tubulin suppressor-like RCC1 family protein
VAGGHRFTSITVGGHACGITDGGQALCWGANSDGQLGDETMTDRRDPVLVTGGIAFTRIDAGTRTTCGLRADGAAFCWGSNFSGALGTGSFSQGSSSTPLQVAGGVAFRSISQGGDTTCGVSASGAAYCWGLLMLTTGGMIADAANAPRAVPGGVEFQSLSASQATACGVAVDGGIMCWGYNFNGNLGTGNTVDSVTPVQVRTG